MRIATASLFLAALTISAAATAHAEDPRLDRIDYTNPKAQLVVGGQTGAGQRARGITAQLVAKGRTPEGTLSQIVRWVGRNLRTDRNKAKTFRPIEQILKDGSVGGDADRVMVMGVFARLAGIPAVWVKSLHEDWIRTQKRKQRPIQAAGGGRTFLEVHLGGRWQLLDPVTARLYADYDVKVTRLPGGHIAYDKGGDPYTLVLGNRFELWRGQVLTYLRRLQLPRDRWATSKDLLASWRVFVTGDRGAATYARDACKTLGFLVSRASGSNQAAALKRARGKTLMVTVSRGVPTLPQQLWAQYLGRDVADLYKAGKKPAKPWTVKTLSDGTRVILITVEQYGPVELAVSEALEG